MKAKAVLLCIACFRFLVCEVTAQSVLFNFDTAPLYTPLPLYQTSGGITAHFTATGQGYSIQAANTMGFTPVGFAGNCIYPSSIYASDLLISFDILLTDISIMYAPQELATDSSCTMKMSAYLGSTFVASNTYSNPNPGTWPTGILALTSSAQAFDNVVVHYQAPPVTGGDLSLIHI